MTPWIFAIDNGNTGAIAVLNPERELVGLHDMPVRIRDEEAASEHPLLARRRSSKKRKEARARKELDPEGAKHLLFDWQDKSGNRLVVVIEEPQIIVSRPGDPRPTNAQAIARTHLSTGIWLGLCLAEGIEVVLYNPKIWQRHMIPFASGEKLKEASVLEASKLFPQLEELVVGPRGGLKDGRSDAVLLAVYGHERWKKEALLKKAR